jgi:geranylgeranyl reductase family protein
VTLPHRHDALVIGGGPSGAAAAHWLARAGRDVAVVEKKTFPREKTCGDGLTPRAVTQLRAMGLEERIAAHHHKYDGLRCIAHGTTLEMRWPEHPVHPSHGYVVRRRDLDTLVAEEAAARGATLLQGTEALQPILRDGLLRGAVVKDKASGEERELHARYVVIADGSLSRFGRALGNQRDRRLVQGTAIRGYFESPLHDDPWIESALDVRDRNGDAMPGYGWIFPCGDGTINVGIGLLSTFRGWRDINTTHLMHEWASTLPEHWGIDPDAMLGKATSGRLPMGGSIHPKNGPTWLAVGDACGSINPFNGEGIDYAYETGRMAAELIDEALTEGSARPLARYPEQLEEEYGLYFRVARAFAVVIGQPALMQQLTRIGVQSRPLMEWVLRIMANLLRPDELGPAEAAYRAVAALARIVPERIPA